MAKSEPIASGTFDFSFDRPAAQQFYALSGLCINMWTQIDRGLFECAVFAMKAEPKLVAIVYYTWLSFGQRKNLVVELMDAVLDVDEHKREWNEIIKSIDANSGFRNTLAHQPVIHQHSLSGQRSEDGKSITLSTKEELFIEPEPYEQLRKKPKNFVVTVTDLRSHRSEVEKLTLKFALFRERLGMQILTPRHTPPNDESQRDQPQLHPDD